MSAFMCSDKHISTIIEEGSLMDCSINLDGRFVDFRTNEEMLANILKLANYNSIAVRYGEDEASRDFGEEDAIRYEPQAVSKIQLLKLCDSFNYQACEVDDYEETEAFRIVETVKSFACRRLDGWEEAEWAI